MTVTNRQKKFSVKFELSPKGMVGAGVVCFCIFLWMFLLGVWAGQTIFRPSVTSRVTPLEISIPSATAGMTTSDDLSTTAKVEGVEESGEHDDGIVEEVLDSFSSSAPVTESVTETVAESVVEPAVDAESEQSFFGVQIGAYKKAGLAGKEVEKWQAKGYDAYLRPPEGADDSFTRVFIGKFSTMDEAKQYTTMLKEKEGLKPFIALISTAEVQ
ncbi:MAG: SPOR domain-containing protein [Proteobacteria bacterium]|nr:SPOR domain-containing protein [Pseudomonadota bacterium]MBU1688711.1 SPOR domain-containing protein [Pseudomonadota bacterium]